MENKKSASWTFRCTVITVLTLIALFLLRDSRRERLLFGKSGSPAAESGVQRQILERTIARIEKLKSVTAKIGVQVSIGKVEVEGNGKYEELFLKSDDSQPRARAFCYGGVSLFRLHLEIPRTGEWTSENLEDNVLDIVCDKNTLWNYTSIEGEKRLTELKLGEMAAILMQACENPQQRENLELNLITFPSPLSGFPGLGGITGTLRRLTAWYEFPDEADSVTLRGKNGSLRAWRLTGTLKPEAYAKTVENLLGTNTGSRKKYMDQFPSVVEVYISQQLEFPYRFCYYSTPEAGSKKRRKLVTFDLTDVYENHFSVVPENFVYTPGGLNSTDVTHSYIETLIPDIDF